MCEIWIIQAWFDYPSLKKGNTCIKYSSIGKQVALRSWDILVFGLSLGWGGREGYRTSEMFVESSAYHSTPI